MSVFHKAIVLVSCGITARAPLCSIRLSRSNKAGFHPSVLEMTESRNGYATSCGRTEIAAPHLEGKPTTTTLGCVESADNATQMEAVRRDFRSDTMTIPTDDMFDAMKAASRGDDVYGEDDTTIAFQKRMAQLTGKESALFCVSGTMTNQLGVRTWLTQPPHSVIVDSRAHVHNYEAGGIAFHSQAMAIPVSPSNGRTLTLEDITPLVVPEDIHFAPTRLVCLENTIKGLIHPQDEVIRISDVMHSLGITMHLDGARLWEVAAKTGMSIQELCDPFDSVSLCMSKGLGAPIGSVLVGPKAFIAKARWFRKMFGGGTRQCGSLAAAANYCLTHHLPQLPRTHALATRLARSLAHLGVNVLLPVETNHVIIDTSPIGVDLLELCRRAKERRLKLAGSRLIVHIQTSEQAAEDLIALVAEMKQEAESAGKAPQNSDSSRQVAFQHANGLYQGVTKGAANVVREGIPCNGN